MINHKVVFIGNSAVGKTSIINQYMYDSTSAEHQPTVGIDFFAKTLNVDGKSVRMQIWDTAGQEKFNSLIPNYIRDSTVAVMVFDLSNRDSFDQLEKWHKMVSDIANPKLIIVGNKCDLEKHEVSKEEAEKYAQEKNSQYIETSATAPTNINELFNMIAAIPVETEEPEAETKEAEKKPEAKAQTQAPGKVVDITNGNQQQNGGGCAC